MLTFTDLPRPDDYLATPRIDLAEVRLLWHADFWDGRRSGLLLYRGERCWFEVVAEMDEGEGWFRRFVVLRLSKDQLVEELYWHDLFRRHVGHHTDYTEEGQRPPGEESPSSDLDLFYDAYATRRPAAFEYNPILGWFEM